MAGLGQAVQMAERRVRKPNFIDAELELCTQVDCLIQLFARHRHVLDRRLNQAVPSRTKTAVWKLIAAEVDARNPTVHRTEPEIRKKWKELKLGARRDVLARRRGGQGKESRYTEAVLAALAGRQPHPRAALQHSVPQEKLVQSPQESMEYGVEIITIKEEPREDATPGGEEGPPLGLRLQLSSPSSRQEPPPGSPPEGLPVIGPAYSLQPPPASPPASAPGSSSHPQDHNLDLPGDEDAIEVDSESEGFPSCTLARSNGTRQFDSEDFRSRSDDVQKNEVKSTDSRPSFANRSRARVSPGRSGLFPTDSMTPAIFDPASSRGMDLRPVDLTSRDVEGGAGVPHNASVLGDLALHAHLWKSSLNAVNSRPPAFEVTASRPNDVSAMMDFHAESPGRSRLLGYGLGGVLSPATYAGLVDLSKAGTSAAETAEVETLEALYRRLLTAEVARAHSEVQRNEELVRKTALERHKLSLEIRLLEKQLSQ